DRQREAERPAGARHAPVQQEPRRHRPAHPRAVPRDPAKRHRAAGHGRVPGQQGAGDLRRHRVRRAVVRLVRQVRRRLWLAELHQAHRTGEHRRTARHLARDDPYRGALRPRRQPPRPRVPGWATRPRRPALLHQFGGPALHPARADGSRGVRRLPGPGRGHPMKHERAVLAGGWCLGMQDLSRKQPGVVSTRVGYSGGDVPNATYRNHGTHAESIEVIFDPEVMSFRDLLEFFFQMHDPTTENRQGNDIGTSYRSAIFYTSPAQTRVAEETIADVDAAGLWPGKVVTQVEPVGDFWEAEPEHQDYLERLPDGYTCHFVRPDWKLPRRG